jgi:hypothetical protein
MKLSIYTGIGDGKTEAFNSIVDEMFLISDV